MSGGGSTTGGLSTSGNGDVQFYFSVVDSKSETAPLIFTGIGGADANGQVGIAAAFVRWEIDGSGAPVGNFTACSAPGRPPGTCDPFPPSFNVSMTYNAIPSSLYKVDVYTMGINGNDPGDSWSASANLKVRIDPTFADASDFTLEFSPNEFSPNPAPELGSLLLLGTGLLALVGFNLKRFMP